GDLPNLASAGETCPAFVCSKTLRRAPEPGHICGSSCGCAYCYRSNGDHGVAAPEGFDKGGRDPPSEKQSPPAKRPATSTATSTTVSAGSSAETYGSGYSGVAW
ncbi:unnamed protein product, partial [Laminaria digitata]